MKKVGILYDSVSSNTGDIAICIALQQGLARRNIQAEIINPFDYDAKSLAPLIIGGGQLLRDPGDDFYDMFRAKGAHILNSIGVSGTKDFKYLSRYKYLSARSTPEAEILHEQTGKQVSVLPCTTTILESPHHQIKGLDLKKGEKVVGIHLVPDTMLICPDLIQIINAIPHKKVFIPFTHYNFDKSFMESLPIDKSNAIVLGKLEPLQLHSVISQMDYVIVSSLHASIFAYSQNVPFISMYQKKTYDYFKDRRLGGRIFKNQEQLKGLIDSTEKSPRSMRTSVERDKAAVNSALDAFASIIKRKPDVKISKTLKGVQADIKRLRLENKQLSAAITKRDILNHNTIYHDMATAESHRQELLESIQRLQQEEAKLRQELKDTRDKSVLERLARRAVRELRRVGDKKKLTD